MRTLLSKSGLGIQADRGVSSVDLPRISQSHNLSPLPSLDPPNNLCQSTIAEPFGLSENDGEYIRSYDYSYRNDFVCEVDGVRLLGPNGVGVSSSGDIIEDTISMPGQNRVEASIRESYIHHPFLTFTSLNNKSGVGSHTSIDLACSLYSSWNNYYHWILEHLPKLRALNYYKNSAGKEPAIIIPSDPPSYILQPLDLFNIDRDDCIEWDFIALDLDTLVLPAYPEANPENLHWLRTNLRQSIEENSLDNPPQRIYISRENAPKRRIENRSEVIEVLSDFGFEKVIAEDLSLSKQIQLFSNADVILGAHGAGLTNILWSDDTTIFEIHNDTVRDHYCVLSNNLGHDYVPIQGESTNPSQLNSNIVVETEELVNKLDNL